MHLSDLTRLVIAPEDCDSLPKPHFQADQQRHLNKSHHSSETNRIWRNLLQWNMCWKRSEPFRRCSSPCRHSRPWKGNLCRETFRQFGKVPSGRGTGRARRRKQLRGISPEDIFRISLKIIKVRRLVQKILPPVRCSPCSGFLLPFRRAFSPGIVRLSTYILHIWFIMSRRPFSLNM